MVNIFGWVGMREQYNILAGAQNHADRVLETVKAFCQAIEAFSKGTLADAIAHCQEVHRFEHESDQIRRQLLDDLSSGLIFPRDRGDLMSFVESMDAIADYANGAARLLEFLEQPLSVEITDRLNSFAADNVMAVAKLKEATDCLNRREMDRALRLCNDVEEIEERGDDLKRVILGLILEAGLAPPVLVLVHDLLNSIEDTSDRAEDSADMLRLLVIKNR